MRPVLASLSMIAAALTLAACESLMPVETPLTATPVAAAPADALLRVKNGARASGFYQRRYDEERRREGYKRRDRYREVERPLAVAGVESPPVIC